MRIKVEFSHVFGQLEFFPVRLLFPREIYIKKTSDDSFMKYYKCCERDIVEISVAHRSFIMFFDKFQHSHV